MSLDKNKEYSLIQITNEIGLPVMVKKAGWKPDAHKKGLNVILGICLPDW
ncbi:MAG: hypothetical protein IKM73_02355 [Acidaminococcaceae bacterium]|nr:hypothetical protein [Acidaminococcaceae bacterium]